MAPQSSRDYLSVTQHEVLRSQECDAIREKVFALSEFWVTRSEAGDFLTLGTASYLDAPATYQAYVRASQAINPVLRESLDWLYDRVRKGFEELLEEPVCFADDCALPGFHIFTFKGEDLSHDNPAARAHFDLQWMHAMPDCRPTQTLSFTLSIEEPIGGSSMEIWPAHYRTVRPDFDALKYASTCPSQTLRYARGQMIVHDGLLLHAIGRASIARPIGHRITFQGHGARTSDGWKLYW